MLRASLGFLVTSCIGQLQWSWYLEARPLNDVVLFHEAANGTFGPARWLWDKRLRQPLTALGAMISIVALAIDPFIQQLIHAADCSRTLSNDIPASVPRTNHFNQNGRDNSLKPHLLQMILDSLNTFQNVTDFECSTGNCTFRNTYSSLAFCSQCSDRSSEVVVDEQCSVASFATETSDAIFNQGPCNVSEEQRDTTLWNLTTSWPPFDVNFYYSQALNVSGTSPAPTVFSIQAEEQITNTLLYSEPIQPISFILCMGAMILPRTTPGAVEAMALPRRINETIVEESNLDQIWGFGEPEIYINGIDEVESLIGLLDLQFVTDSDRRSLVEDGYDLVNARRWLPYNITFHPSNPVKASSPFPESLLANDCLYIIGPFFIEGFGLEILWPYLVGNVTRNFIEEDGPDFGYVFEGTPQLLHLYDLGNVSTESIRDTCNSKQLTLWARSNGEPGYSGRAEGDVDHYAVRVRVTWAWITLPAALVGLALVMLALTVATTARRAVPMLELFPLAVLQCGPAGHKWVDRDLLAANASKAGKTPSCHDGSVDGMSRLASQISVQLLEQDGKYQLCQVGVRAKKVQH
ncbi:hypothetical protein LA080_000248 [Diaporthe eres]|nr:hypothetical protein LA080_000248 [Diaporthe eres]